MIYDRSIQLLQDKLFPHVSLDSSLLFFISFSVPFSSVHSIQIFLQAKELDDKLEREFYLQRGIRCHPSTGEHFEHEGENEKEKEAVGEREGERPLKRAKKEESRENSDEKETEKERTPGKEKLERSGTFHFFGIFFFPILCSFFSLHSCCVQGLTPTTSEEFCDHIRRSGHQTCQAIYHSAGPLSLQL